jgi:hypothetical protein
MNRRVLALTALLVVGLSSVTGAGSVSSVSADRDVSVAVVEDREAYLGLEFDDFGNETATLTVSNRLSTEPLDVTIEGGGATESKTLGVGEQAAFDVSCGDELHVSAVAPGAEVNATRTVDCSEQVPGDSDDEDVNGSEDSEGDEDGDDAGEDENDDDEGDDDEGGEDDSGVEDDDTDEDDEGDEDD